MKLSLCMLLVGLALCSAKKPAPSNGSCKVRGTVKFSITIQGLWSRKKFPKQYPLYRPHAQFSKTIGRTHADAYRMWHEGEEASEDLIHFMADDIDDSSHATAFEMDVQGQSGILDVFEMLPIDSGTDAVSAVALADHQHYKFSMATVVIPSPDWFIGVDSIPLCRGSRWLKNEVIELFPMDAGTDQGATFTSPVWPEWPREPIKAITAHHPNHSASSFFYPQLKKLPPLAKLKIKRIHEIIKRRPEGQLANATIAINQTIILGSDTTSAEVEVTPKMLKTTKKRNRGDRKRNQKKNNIDDVLIPIDCVVSEWSEWGTCSKTCGYGRRSRTRSMESPPKHGAVPCPELEEEQMCGSMKNCRWSHFGSWSSYLLGSSTPSTTESSQGLSNETTTMVTTETYTIETTANE